MIFYRIDFWQKSGSYFTAEIFLKLLLQFMFQNIFQIYLINPWQIEVEKLEKRFTHSLQNNWRFGLSLNLLAKYRKDLHNLGSLPIKIVKLRQKESNSSKNAYMIKKRIQQPNNRRGSIAGMYSRVVSRLYFHF